MPAIVVPTINSNDTDALLIAWHRIEGESVQAGETIATLETTKASFELAAEASGFLKISAQPGQRYLFGASLGKIVTEGEAGTSTPDIPSTAPGGTHDLVITKAAQALIDSHGLTANQLRELGKRVIKSEDLSALLPSSAVPASKRATTGTPIPAQQQTIARVVSHSRREIPDAFLLKRVLVDDALHSLGEFGREHKAMAGIADLLVWILGRLPQEFPFFFGTLHNDLRFEGSGRGNVGVTFDLGGGLFIPVVKSAGARSLAEIAKQMMSYRLRAARNSFKTDDLSDGDISLSINADADVVCVMPVILPSQTCMVSLSAVLTEVILTADGPPRNRRYVHLGLAYDHRVINGFEANAFVNAIKSRIERPDPSAWLSPTPQ